MTIFMQWETNLNWLKKILSYFCGIISLPASLNIWAASLMHVHCSWSAHIQIIYPGRLRVKILSRIMRDGGRTSGNMIIRSRHSPVFLPLPLCGAGCGKSLVVESGPYIIHEIGLVLFLQVATSPIAWLWINYSFCYWNQYRTGLGSNEQDHITEAAGTTNAEQRLSPLKASGASHRQL